MTFSLTGRRRPRSKWMENGSGDALAPDGWKVDSLAPEKSRDTSQIPGIEHMDINDQIYYCESVELISDCEGLLGLMDKNLVDVDHRKLQKILETAIHMYVGMQRHKMDVGRHLEEKYISEVEFRKWLPRHSVRTYVSPSTIKLICL